MTFGKLRYTGSYEDRHPDVVASLKSAFEQVEEGLQGDSWIWVWSKNQKVRIDTFPSMTHEIKSDCAGAHLNEVFRALKRNFECEVYSEPELEPHE